MQTVNQRLAEEVAGLLKVKHAARRVCQTLATLQAKGEIEPLGACEADLRALLGETDKCPHGCIFDGDRLTGDCRIPWSGACALNKNKDE